MNIYDIFMQRIDKIWEQGPHRINWLLMEQMLVDILRCEQLTDAARVILAKQCIDAHTRRGHFV